jgi:hypothetical protein
MRPHRRQGQETSTTMLDTIQSWPSAYTWCGSLAKCYGWYSACTFNLVRYSFFMHKFTLAFLLAAGLAGLSPTHAQTTAALNSRTNPLPPPTTQEEYNYATKGLQAQRTNGLDMKVGYILSNKTTLPVGRYIIQLEDLVRSANGTVACTVLQVSDNPATPQGGTAYFCIPNPGSPSEIWSQFNQAQQRVTSPAFLQAVTYGLATRVSAMTTAAMLAIHKP